MKQIIYKIPEFFRRVGRSSLSWCRQQPEVLFAALASVFYWNHLVHLPPGWRIFFVGYTTIGTWALGRLGMRLLRRRLARADLRLWPELLIAAALCALIYFTDYVREGWLEWFLPLGGWLWLLWASIQGRTGVFYIGFLTLVVFVFAVFAHRVLFFQAWALNYVSHYLHQARSEESREQGYRWQDEAGPQKNTGIQTLYHNDQRRLSVTLPPQSFFHDGRQTSYLYGVPQPGEALCYISSSEQDPFALPAVGIFRLPGTPRSDVALELDASEEASLRDSVEHALVLRQRAGELDNLSYRGQTRLPIYAAHESLAGAPGIVYEYHDRVLNESARLTVYLSPQRRYAIVVSDAPDEGFDFEAQILAILRGLRVFSDAGS